MISKEFIRIVTQDLRRFAAVLLESGLAPTTVGVRHAGIVNLAHLEDAVDVFTAQVPRLLTEAATENRLARHCVQRTTPVPRRARASRAPWHQEMHEGRLLPVRWITTDPVPAPSPEAVAYLGYLLAVLQAGADQVSARMTKHLKDAYAARSDDSPFAREEKKLLEATFTRVRRCDAEISRTRRLLWGVAGCPPRPRSQPPRPALIGPAWRKLRRLAPRLLGPSVALPRWLGALLDPAARTPELSFLYQRWCGMRILETLVEKGFHPRGDAAGPLFLGEQSVRLTNADGVPLVLWCEPRMIRGKMHESGVQSLNRAEQQPDYVLLAPGESGLDAYVLDATLSTNRERLLAKGAYRTTLAFESMRLIAGVPIPKRPLRSWAVAPVTAETCQLNDPEGRTGTIPLHPERHGNALRAWLEDVARSARAWWPRLAASESPGSRPAHEFDRPKGARRSGPADGAAS